MYLVKLDMLKHYKSFLDEKNIFHMTLGQCHLSFSYSNILSKSRLIHIILFVQLQLQIIICLNIYQALNILFLVFLHFASI